MKKEWFEPRIVDISVRMTEDACKRAGSGDNLAEGLPLNPWDDPCCPDCES